MTLKILLDHDIEGYAVYLEAALQETGWDQYLAIEFICLRDLGLADDCSDRKIWRRIQQDRLLLITHNRNRDDKTSLQATIEKETKSDSLPVLTIPNVGRLLHVGYRQLAIHKLAEIVLYLDNHLGVGRIYIP